VAAAGVVSLAGYAVGFPLLGRSDGQALGAYAVLFSALYLLYVVVAWLVLRRPAEDRALLWAILGFGLLFRVVLLDTPVLLSSDVYRYLWDGRVQSRGLSPYRYPPAAAELSHLRDPEIHPRINRPEARTVYPPGAQALFALAARVAPDSLRGWRLLILGGEVATAILLLVLLRRLRRPLAGIVIYAWAPLAVVEGVQAGHLEAVMLPTILLALLWRQRGSALRAGAALGAAALVKLYPAVLLLAWRRRGEWRLPLAAGVVIVAGYLCYLPAAGTDVLGFLPRYFGSAEDFNVGLRFFLTEGIGLAGEAARGTVMLGLFALLIAVLLSIGRTAVPGPQGVLDAGMAAAAAYLVLVPTAMHAWYALWILPFVTLRPSVAWLWFTGAVSLSYLKYQPETAIVPLWVRALEYIPLYTLLVWEWWRHPGHEFFLGTPTPSSSTRASGASRPT